MFFNCGLWYSVVRIKILLIKDRMMSVIEVIDLKMIKLRFFGGRSNVFDIFFWFKFWLVSV